jgi:hypothetical protein
MAFDSRRPCCRTSAPLPTLLYPHLSTTIPLPFLNTRIHSLTLGKLLVIALNISIHGQVFYHALLYSRLCVSETFHRRIQHA